MKRIDLTGVWEFCLDADRTGIRKEYFNKHYQDTIILPATVSTAQKSMINQTNQGCNNTGSLTDPYYYEGYTWYTREVEVGKLTNREFFLVLERTRVSQVWIEEQYIGCCNSLTTSHRYRLTPYVKGQMKITIMIDNTTYPVKGGHMTSADTQTNWNGITGEIYIEEYPEIYISNVQIYTDPANFLIKVKIRLNGTRTCRICAEVCGKERSFKQQEYDISEGDNTFLYPLDETVHFWSEHIPYLYRLNLTFMQEESFYLFGLRDFKAAGKYFEINGSRTFLRGKHDGLVFPLTGHAPTDLDSWLKVLGTAKEYGINHYRFHTCCPPRACFDAADILGMYLEVELPFWGTVTEAGEENHEAAAQEYLIEEGFRILDEFGNHPSFVMMSLGNELWGSKKVLNGILGQYKAHDNRHLYTQGSNNFQFMPCILENEDFYCGVRFSKERLFRGSYAMCDAPQGHIQTMAPDTIYNYNSLIRPEKVIQGIAENGETIIQFGTGTRRVKMDAVQELIPEIPVVSHEIGQYAMYPDFSEISRYTGVLKAENLTVFKERLVEKGMFSMSDSFFKASGNFAVQCYKAEIETALRSSELAGFQLLDLQDFPGQGTALVGILNAFMENKGIISSREWRQFCNDTVLLAELPGFVYQGGEELTVGIKLAAFGQEEIVKPKISFTMTEGKRIFKATEYVLQDTYFCGVYKLWDVTIRMPELSAPAKLTIKIGLNNPQFENCYDIWVYPKADKVVMDKSIIVTDNRIEAIRHVECGHKVLLYLEDLKEDNSIPGTYCTDFWCYPMFRSISESMGKLVPVGTHGLFIKNKHEIFSEFPTEYYTTAQWYEIITGSRALMLDGTNIEPIVWTIDNFERNHKLGNLFEIRIGEGRMLIITFSLHRLKEYLPARWLEYSILKYMSSDAFEPDTAVELDWFREWLK